ncbi:hypothetical protein MBLNU459_g7899t1 [Dothideomycetes sp. NU459]
MFSSSSRKRAFDADGDLDVAHYEKKPRCSAGHESTGFTSSNITQSSLLAVPDHSATMFSEVASSGEDDSIRSTVSEASSSDMDMTMDTGDDFRMAFSQSPDQPSSWALRSSPLRSPRMLLDVQGSRVPTPVISAATRPKPAPLQTSDPSSSTSIPYCPLRNHLGNTTERVPSPISEDEPHTPTTVAGSQLSLLTVTDVDMDMEPAEPPEIEAVVVRKQRARSGAFTSPRDPSKKLSMGYRDDCEKCRNRVPGHMNHFLGP